MLLTRVSVNVPKLCKRNIGVLAPALQKALDPIQQLFIDKIRDYKVKSQGGKLVDATPEIERERSAELERIAQQYGGENLATMSEFPKLSFTDPPIETGLEK